jgi:hypothetical protein
MSQADLTKRGSRERTYSRQTASERKGRYIFPGSCPWSGVGGGIVGSGRCFRREQEQGHGEDGPDL